MTDQPETPDQNADGTWLHDQLDPIVDATPAPDAWAAISARAHGPATHDAPIPIAAGHRSRRWLVAAAAAIALLVAATVVVTRDDGSSSVVATTPNGDAGWYVPVGLPDGWSLGTAWVLEDGAMCTQDSRSWTRSDADPDEDTQPRIELTYDGCGTTKPSPGTTGPTGPALGEGVDHSEMASFMSKPSSSRVQWQKDGAWTLNVKGGLTSDQMIDAAKAIVADPRSTDAPLPGFTITDVSHLPAVTAAPTVVVELEAPTGELVSYRLAAPGESVGADPFGTDESLPIAGQPNPVVHRSGVDMRPEGDAKEPLLNGDRYFGHWPGAELDVPGWIFKEHDEITPPTAAQVKAHDALLQTMIGALRPVSAEEWRTFLATSSDSVKDPRLTTAAAISDIGNPSNGTTGRVDPANPGTSTPLDESTSTTIPDSEFPDISDSGPVVSGPGVSTPNPKPKGEDAEVNEMIYNGFTELDDLTIRLELDSGVIRAGQPVTGTLIFTNATDHDIDFTECSEGLMQHGLVPADEPEQALPIKMMTDCYGTPIATLIPGETRFRTPPWDLNRNQLSFAAQRGDTSKELISGGLLGTLDGGHYLAVVDIPGRTSKLRLSVPVTVPAPLCETTDETVAAYYNLTEAEARAKAEEDGDLFRIVSGPGGPKVITDDLRCGRINVDLSTDGIVTNALRY